MCVQAPKKAEDRLLCAVVALPRRPHHGHAFVALF